MRKLNWNKKLIALILVLMMLVPAYIMPALAEDGESAANETQETDRKSVV